MRTGTVLVVPGVGKTCVVGGVVGEVAVRGDGDGVSCCGVGDGCCDVVIFVGGAESDRIVCGGVGELSGTRAIRVDI